MDLYLVVLLLDYFVFLCFASLYCLCIFCFCNGGGLSGKRRSYHMWNRCCTRCPRSLPDAECNQNQSCGPVVWVGGLHGRIVGSSSPCFEKMRMLSVDVCPIFLFNFQHHNILVFAQSKSQTTSRTHRNKRKTMSETQP
jgi:hypothetical protein